MATDMRDVLDLLSDADKHAEDVQREHADGIRSLRDLITVADLLRWYEQSPKEE